MNEAPGKIEFASSLASFMDRFLEEKHACGYEYDRESLCLQNLDRFLVSKGWSHLQLSKVILDQWTGKKPYERPANHAFRLTIARQFAKFLLRQGLEAHLPPCSRISPTASTFVARIFSRDEMRRLFEAADQLPRACNSPLRHLVFPELFRLNYGCGLRLGETLRLKVGDVDLREGTLTIRQGKFRNDRLVPVSPSMRDRLGAYASTFGGRASGDIFFPAPDGGRYSNDAAYTAFRQILRAAGIPHGGRGQGPRPHDLRHTFAVHCLIRWYRQGLDLDAQLPVLATYMGHRSIKGTQRYLRLTADLFPDVAARLETTFGRVIPGGGDA